MKVIAEFRVEQLIFFYLFLGMLYLFFYILMRLYFPRSKEVHLEYSTYAQYANPIISPWACIRALPFATIFHFLVLF